MDDPNKSDLFVKADSRVDIGALEASVLELWDKTKAFERSVEMRPAESEYTFYDGPPFPTGTPHYGNLLAGVIKDIVPRYWTMRGHRVERRFGWDTHGLPIEMEVEKELGLSGPRQIGDYGIDRFNEACRVRVEANTKNWEYITRRLGRWIDFENDYKTMDVDFMESVWWVMNGCGKRTSSTRTSRYCRIRGEPRQPCPISRPTSTTARWTIRNHRPARAVGRQRPGACR